MKTDAFQEIVWREGRELYRQMPWRDDASPYRVWVSELMLQQTQVGRVIPKFEAFVARYPSMRELAGSSLSDVLTSWNGLGYNRRAKFLWQAARQIIAVYEGNIPMTGRELVGLPGIGPNTAAAIMNYAYEVPTAFVETNIRTVYFHYFFQDQLDVDDKKLLALVDRTMDHEQPREWFWALMDYGAHLKATAGGRLDQSRHYKRQSPLAGSNREMRGRIIHQLNSGPLSDTGLRERVQADDRYDRAMEELKGECMIAKVNELWQLSGHGG